MYTYSESEYSLSFRREESLQLADHIRYHRNVELVGMKRVGISNFLRFFLYNPRVTKTYFVKDSQPLLVPVDLLDLVEQDAYAFWLLTLKRIDDSVQASTLDTHIKHKIAHVFEKAIQIKDVFFTLDSIRQSLRIIVSNKFSTAIFFIRFDRVSEVMTPEMFGNLQGLVDAASHRLSYVFTSARRLHNLKPDVFTRTTMSVFSHEIFIQPTQAKDSEIIFATLKKKYNLTLNAGLHHQVLSLCRGHVQYLQLSLIILSEFASKAGVGANTIDSIKKDERILLQSEELLASLKQVEVDSLSKILSGEPIDAQTRQEARYLWNVGIVQKRGSVWQIFSPLFLEYVQEKITKKTGNGGQFLTKKEHVLFNLLKKYENQICERDVIIEKVWSEFAEIGVSDWAVDRLVARLRKKMKAMSSEYAIKTIRTRGFMIVRG